MLRWLNKQQIAFELIQDFLVSFSLTITALLVSNAVFSVTCHQRDLLCLGDKSVDRIHGPREKLGEFLCGKLKLKGPLSFLFTMLMIVLIHVVGISLRIVLKNIGFHRQLLGVWAGLL